MNQLYTPTRQKFLTAQINWNTANKYLLLVNGTYIFDTNHEFLSQIPVGQRVATADIPGEFSSAGYAQGGQAQFLNLVSAVPVVAAVIYINTGVEATSSLISFYDNVEGFPFTPAGLDYFISQDIVFGGFFRL